jgi:hypothetical protein
MVLILNNSEIGKIAFSIKQSSFFIRAQHKVRFACILLLFMIINHEQPMARLLQVFLACS